MLALRPESDDRGPHSTFLSVSWQSLRGGVEGDVPTRRIAHSKPRVNATIGAAEREARKSIRDVWLQVPETQSRNAPSGQKLSTTFNPSVLAVNHASFTC
jgi:hypothetical protein